MPSTTFIEPIDVSALRATEFPYISDIAYLDAASVTPLPERARRAIENYNRRRSRIHELSDADFGPTLQRCREAAARLVNADPDEIALGSNTSFGINLAARCLPIRPGTTVVVSDREFPANVYPWLALERQGVRVEIVPTNDRGWPDESRLMERLDSGGVSVFALSAVQFASGYRADLSRLGRFCRERGIFYVVDAIQALGYIPIDVRAIDADIVATGGHKWLCGPYGAGFSYVRRDLLSRLEPAVVGWTAMVGSGDLTSLLDYQYAFRDDARRFEVSTMPFQDFAGLTQSLELLLEIGVSAIGRHVGCLIDALLEWIADRPEIEIASDLRAEHRSGILCFRPPAPEIAFSNLRNAGVTCALREGVIRISPHLYNTMDDIDRVTRAMEELEP